MDNKMELYYNDGYNKYQREVKGISILIKIKRKIKRFIKIYCSDYFSFTINAGTVIYLVIQFIMKNV